MGISENVVAPGRREERKSVGVERTFRDKTEDKEIMEMLTEIAEELHKDMENLQYAGKTVTVKYKLHTFESEYSYRKVHAHSIRQDASAIRKKVDFNKRRDLACKSALLIRADCRLHRSCSRRSFH